MGPIRSKPVSSKTKSEPSSISLNSNAAWCTFICLPYSRSPLKAECGIVRHERAPRCIIILRYGQRLRSARPNTGYLSLRDSTTTTAPGALPASHPGSVLKKTISRTHARPILLCSNRTASSQGIPKQPTRENTVRVATRYGAMCCILQVYRYRQC